MDMLAMFVPLAKADAAQRLVYGYIDETPDRAGEVLDYATAKPAFSDWSESMHKASGGKSYGNIRAQHDLKKAAGKLTDITFDDDAKSISFVAHIVDDQEWAKVEAGVYTGFSPGGSYAKRWQDGAYRRYTPRVGELSIVDVPCIPSGAFTMVKADGAEEQIDFVMSRAYEPGNDATKARAEKMAKAAGSDAKAKDYVGKARSDLIAENVAAELVKVHTPAASPVEALDAVLAKADAALAGPMNPHLPEPLRDFAKTANALNLIKWDAPLAKSLYSVNTLTGLLQQFSYLQGDVTMSALIEGDDSAQPAKAAAIMQAMGDLLVTMVQEEVANLLSGLPDDMPVVMDGDGDDMALAASIVDLVKADKELMAKSGARNSASDQKTIQSMHDDTVALGATCGGEAEKVEALAQENERLAKAASETMPRLEKATATIDRLVADRETDRAAMVRLEADLAMIKAQPMPGKGAVIAVAKEAETAGNDLNKPADDLAAMPAGQAKANEILRRAGMIGMAHQFAIPALSR